MCYGNVRVSIHHPYPYSIEFTMRYASMLRCDHCMIKVVPHGCD